MAICVVGCFGVWFIINLEGRISIEKGKHTRFRNKLTCGKWLRCGKKEIKVATIHKMKLNRIAFHCILRELYFSYLNYLWVAGTEIVCSSSCGLANWKCGFAFYNSIICYRPFERIITMHKDSTGHVGFIFKNGKITSIVKDSSAARNGLLTEHNICEINGQNVIGLKVRCAPYINHAVGIFSCAVTVFCRGENGIFLNVYKTTK